MFCTNQQIPEEWGHAAVKGLNAVKDCKSKYISIFFKHERRKNVNMCT